MRTGIIKKRRMIISVLNRKIVACCCLLMVAGIGTAQTENEKSNLLTKVKAFVNRNVVHRGDTNYVKAPKQPWQVSVKSRAVRPTLFAFIIGCKGIAFLFFLQNYLDI